MKSLRPWLVTACLVTIGPAAPFIVLAIYAAGHDAIALWNTRYTSRFSSVSFAQVAEGTPRETLVRLLGSPLRTRARFGADGEVEGVTLDFSEPEEAGDYDSVLVHLDREGNVTRIDRGITD